MKKNVCVITPVHYSYGIGGIEYQVKLLVEELLLDRNIKLTYLTRKIASTFKSPLYQIRQISKETYFRRISYFLDTFKLLKLLNNYRPDVIYQNGGCAHTGIAAYYAKKSDCRMIWHVASDNDLKIRYTLSDLKPNKYIDKKALHWGIKNAETLIAQTEYQKKLIHQFKPNANVHIVRNFHPLPDPGELSEKKNQIVWVANFKKLKQPDLYIKLAKALHRRNLNIQCIMVGAPASYPKGYQSHIEGQILDVVNLQYLGKLSQNHVNQIIQNSKLFINTSKWEGFPNTFIQAWMRKTPVVSLHCDPDKVIHNHQCGIVSGSIAQMIEDVFNLLRNDKEREKMGENGFNYARKYHSYDNLYCLKKLILS